MSIEAVPTRRKGVFYGWWILIAGTTVQALNGGLYFYGFSVFFTPLIEEFRWSSAALSGAFSTARLESGVAGPVVGFLFDRFGPRALMLLGFTMVGGGYILLSRVNSIEMFYVVFVLLISVGGSLGFGIPINGTAANWFIRKRGLAFGILACGVGIGGFFAPVLAWCVGLYGWRATAIGSGLVFLVAALPIALVMRHKPEQYGYLPDGAPTEQVDEQAPSATGAESPAAPAKRITQQGGDVSFTARQALATRAFWLIALVFTFRQVVSTGIAIHELPAIEHMGFSREIAALALTATMLLSIPGRLGFGWLGDRWDKRYVIGLCMVLHFLGLLAFAFADSVFLIVVFLLLYSPAYGGMAPLTPSTWGDYFGRKSFATISGLSQTVTMWGTITGPLLAGYTFDVSGSYQFAFLCFAAASLMAALPLFLVKRPQVRPNTQTRIVPS